MSGPRDALRRLLSRPLLQDTLRLQAGQVLLVAIHAARSLVAIRWLGPASFGLYALAQSVVTTALIADVTAAARVALVGTAHALGRGEEGDAAGPLADLLRLSLAAAAVIAAGLWWLAPPIAGSVFGRPEVGRYAGWLGLCLIADIPFTLLVVALQSARRMTATATVEVARAGAWLAITVAALAIQASAAALVLAQLLTSLVAGAVAAAAYARVARRDPRLPRWGALLRRALGRRSGPALASGVKIAVDKNLAALAGQLPILLLGRIDAAAVGVLAAAMRVMALPAPLLAGLARNLDAALPARAAAGIGEVRRTFLVATRFAAAGWTVVTVATALVAPLVLVRLLGEAYADGLPLVPVLALQSVVLGVGVGMGAVLRTLDRVGRSIASQVVAVAVTLPLGIWLVDLHGGLGAVWFHALRVAVFTALAFAAVLRLLRPGPPGSAPPAPTS